MAESEADKGSGVLISSDGRPETLVTDIAIRLCLLGLVIYLSLKLFEPFALLLVWAAILTIALFPVYAWLSARLGGRGKLAATLITLLGLAIVLGPVAVLGVSLAETAQWLIEELKGGTLKIPTPPEFIRDWPLIGEKIHSTWVLASTSLEGLLRQYSEGLLSVGGTFIGKIAGVSGNVLIFAASIIVSGFLFGPGSRIAETGRGFAKRVFSDRGAGFIDLAGATIRNVSRGVIGVAVLQTLLAGIGLIMADVPGAGFLCFVILILCILQIGPALIILPVIIWGWYQMDTGVALLFSAYMLPIMLVDNVLKPVLMSRGLETPILVILIGVIGGTISFGLIGLFLGPVILSVFYDLFVTWIAHDEPSGDANPAA